MRKLLVCAGVYTLASLVLPGIAAQAEEAGLAGLHSWVRVGGRTCMADHYHDGNGTGRSRAAAQASAIRAWVDFTAWEYGSRWGSYSAAVGKSMSCSGGGGSWSCSTSARPCRYR
jgi:hypothetical protein